MSRSLLSEALDAAIDQSGLTLRAIAEAAGISAPHLHDVRRDRRGLDPNTARRVAKALGMDEKSFVFYATERSAKSLFTNLGTGCPNCGWPHE